MIDEEEESPQLPDDSEEIAAQSGRLFQEDEIDDDDRIRQVQQQERGRKGRTEAEDQEFFEQSEWLKNKIDNEVGQWANQRMEQRRIENQKILPPSPPKFEESFATYPASHFSRNEPYVEEVPPQAQPIPTGCPPEGAPSTITMNIGVIGAVTGCVGDDTEVDFLCDDCLIDAQPLAPWTSDAEFGCVSANNSTTCTVLFDCTPCGGDADTEETFGAQVVLTFDGTDWIIFFLCGGFADPCPGTNALTGFEQSENLGPTLAGPYHYEIVTPAVGGSATWEIDITIS